MADTARMMLTPLEIFNAIESLPNGEKETLALLMDEKLSEELMRRRKDVLTEMRAGELLTDDELFKGHGNV